MTDATREDDDGVGEDAALFKAFRAIELALGGTIIHVNRGESDDYSRGYNQGFDDREASLPRRAENDAPVRDPWKRAYLRGYEDGYTQEEWEDE